MNATEILRWLGTFDVGSFINIRRLLSETVCNMSAGPWLIIQTGGGGGLLTDVGSIFISYILRFLHQILLCEKAFPILLRPLREAKEFLIREKIVSSNHKPRFKRIVFSRAFSRSSRVALSGSFDKILYFRCTRVVRNSNFQVIKS